MRKDMGNGKIKKGFTLVELIVVIVIILVLAAVLVPSVLRYVAKAQEAKCRSGRDTLTKEYSFAVADGRISWDEDDKDEIDIEKLQGEGILPEFKCPYGGEIYGRKNDDGTIEIRCEYHDDGKTNSGGAGGNSFPGKELKEAVEKYMVEFNKEHPQVANNNSKVLEAFYEKYGMDKVSKKKVSEVLSDDKIENIIPKLAKATGKSPEDARKILDQYKQKEFAVAPFVCEDGKVIMYYADGEKWKTQQHEGTNLLYYEGSWYLYPNTTGSGDNIRLNSGFILPGLRQDKNLEKTLNEKYIKIE